jgi:Ca2+-binding EF-hand superfamily protein
MTDLGSDLDDDDEPKVSEEMEPDKLLPVGRKPERGEKAFTEQQLIEIENAFKVFDADGNGLLDRREMKVAMKGLGMGTNRDDITRIMEEVDADGSGTIDKHEFIEIVRPILGGRDPHAEVRKCFEFFDGNGSGVITAADLASVMQESGEENVTAEEIEPMMQVADMDGDGAVSITDFVRLGARMNLTQRYDPKEASERERSRQEAAARAAAAAAAEI